jgi:hypothetical protein
MYSHTIAVLEKFDNQHDFERMCADLLNAQGYRDVVPIALRGGSDRGMDITFNTEDGGKGLACVTLRKDIDTKFTEDFSQRMVGEFEKYVLFCTTYLTASQKLKFTRYCLDNLEALFVPMDIEALRSLLDSSFRHIRAQYLYIGDELNRQSYSTQVKGLSVSTDKGALVVYAKNSMRGRIIDLYPGFHDEVNLKIFLTSTVVESMVNGQTVFKADFPSLEPGNYTLSSGIRYYARVTILAEQICEVDWR